MRCFSCGVGIGEYSENDFPWEWHAKSSPYCRHVLKEGSAYFQAEYIDIRTNGSQVYITILLIVPSFEKMRKIIM